VVDIDAIIPDTEGLQFTALRGEILLLCAPGWRCIRAASLASAA